MVRAMFVSVILALASADFCKTGFCDEHEQSSLMQMKTTKNSGQGHAYFEDADMMALLDSIVAHPQATAEELVAAEPSVQQALMQRANEKHRRHQLLHAILDLPKDTKLELLRAAETSPEVGRIFRSLTKQTQLKLIEMARADSVDRVVAGKDGDWWDVDRKAPTQAPETTTAAPEVLAPSWATTGFCSAWVGKESSSGLCAEHHVGACFDPDHSKSKVTTQCLSQATAEDYRCPSEAPQKCAFPSKQASLTQVTKTTSSGHKSLKDADIMALFDSLVARPQATAEKLVAAVPSVQQALVQRANEKPRRIRLLDAVLDLPRNKKLELLRAAKTSPEVGRLFRSLSKQTVLKMIEMSKSETESVETSMEEKENEEWWDISGKLCASGCDQAEHGGHGGGGHSDGHGEEGHSDGHSDAHSDDDEHDAHSDGHSDAHGDDDEHDAHASNDHNDHSNDHMDDDAHDDGHD